MLNDRDDDDRHDDHEESEYHFSDEDISYEETEAESPKSVNAGGTRESFVSRLTKSKRMLISIGVFFVLVFIVYKMVAPTSSVPGDIGAPIVSANQQPTNQRAPVVTPPPTVQPVAQAATPTEAAAQQPVVQVQVQPPAPANQVQAQAPITPPPAQQVAAPGTPPPAVNQAPTMQPPMTQATNQMQPVSAPSAQPASQPPPTMPQQQAQAVVSMPSMIPVPPPPAPEAAPMTSTPNVTVVQAPSAPVPQSSVEAKMAALEANNQQLMSQMQADYTQKVNEYSAQNKAMQDQLQSLNSRVAGMEAQLNQLVQAITRSGQGQPTSSIDNNKQLPPIGREIKFAFSVQAIIPGRAWLRSDNGEAVTVAEGDTIKGFGRVTKIDPYDGVVEVNTGNRVVSLSYGNGADS